MILKTQILLGLTALLLTTTAAATQKMCTGTLVTSCFGLNHDKKFCENIYEHSGFGLGPYTQCRWRPGFNDCAPVSTGSCTLP